MENDGGSRHAGLKSLGVNVLGSLIATGILFAFRWLPPLARQFGKTFSFKPTWAAILLLFLAVFGLITLVQKLFDAYCMSRENAEPLDLSLIEVDLRSTNAILAQVVSDIPQLSLWLRITNHSPCDISIKTVSATVSFAQATVELSSAKPRMVEAHTTLADVSLNVHLAGPMVKYIEDFFSRDQDLNRTVYVSIEIGLDDHGTPYTKPVVIFQRYLPEILSIKRWETKKEKQPKDNQP